MFKLTEIAEWLAVDLNGEDCEINSIVTNSEEVTKGALFVALVGPKHDGHDYVNRAIEKGAVAVMVSRPITQTVSHLLVQDTLLGFAELGRFYRSRVSCPVIGLTGTCGKTTVKAMLAHVLAQQGTTLATQANHNNRVGVPQTLVKLRPEHQYAVVECGINEPGEMACLAKMVEPSIAIITNIGPGHLEGLGDETQVAHEKSQLLDHLRPDGVAILNADQPFLDEMKTKLTGKQKLITFGLSEQAEVRAKEIELDGQGYPRFQLEVNGVDYGVFHLPLLGQYQVLNALVVIAACLELAVPIDAIRSALQTVVGVKGRMHTREGINGAVILDDAYNANPTSFEAALQVLAAHQKKHKVVVMGDMKELGERAEQYHQEIGKQAANLGVDYLLVCGDLSQHAVACFSGNAKTFFDRKELVATLRQLLHNDMVVLVKGSHSSKMDEVVEAVLA